MPLKHSNILFIVMILLLLNLVAWMTVPHLSPAPQSDGFTAVQGVTYGPSHHEGQDPTMGGAPPSPESIEADIKLLSTKVSAIRTYSVAKNDDLIPAIARKYGLRVTIGAWISGIEKDNELQVQRAIEVANTNPNVDAVIVGNEVLMSNYLRKKSLKDLDEIEKTQGADARKKAYEADGKQAAERLASYIDRVRAAVKVPVSTADSYGVWIDHPELAPHVDFIAAHFLPYWDGCTIESSIDQVKHTYALLQQHYPDKRIVIGETGWPSVGEYRWGAIPSPWNQEHFIRDFVKLAKDNHYEYFVIEAFDQPWKAHVGQKEPAANSAAAMEASWGLFDYHGNAKFSWDRPTPSGTPWQTQWFISTMLGMSIVGGFLYRRRDLHFEGLLYFSVMLQASISLLTYTSFIPAMPWYGLPTKIAWIFLFPAQIFMIIIMLVQMYELTEMFWLKRWTRRFLPLRPSPTRTKYPKVSIHVACCNEPPDMVIELLDSLAAMNYPNFEVLVLDNNTKNPEVWKPLQERCLELGERFRFFHLEKWPGFKAGALNFGLKETAPDAEIIGCIDADYIVKPEWLKAVIPYFDDASVGLLQCPQDNRSYNRSAFKELCNWEYAGCFHIGMVHRNEYNAIIQHGTMCLMRRSALDHVGHWGEWCICEDSELGLRLLKDGYKSVYVNYSFGHGLVPDSFMAYKKQRFRWAFGAMQILRKHGKDLLPWAKSGLTLDQKYHFIAGWLPWFGDALHLFFTAFLVIWAVGMITLPRYFIVPVTVFVFPSLLLSILNVVRSLWLYQKRVPCNMAQRVGACIFGMGLTYMIGRAVITGFLVKDRPFIRTPKCEKMSAVSKCIAMVRDEVILMLLLWSCIIGVMMTREWRNIPTVIFLVATAAQSIPYAAALASSLISGVPRLDSLINFFGERRSLVLAKRASRERTGLTIEA